MKPLETNVSFLKWALITLTLPQPTVGTGTAAGKRERKSLSVNVLKLFQHPKSGSSNGLLPSPLDEKRSRDQLPEDGTQRVRARFQGRVFFFKVTVEHKALVILVFNAFLYSDTELIQLSSKSLPTQLDPFDLH